MRSQEVVSIERAVSQNNLIANQIQLENTIPYLTYPPDLRTYLNYLNYLIYLPDLPTHIPK